MRYLCALLTLLLISTFTSTACSRDQDENMQAVARDERPRSNPEASEPPAASTADWPQWRGPQRDGRSLATGLLQQWRAEGPKLLWTNRQLGRGYSSPAVVGKRLYIMGSEGDQAQLLALDADSGERIWSANVGKAYENGWGGGPIGTPTVDGDLVYVLGAEGELVCFSAAGGDKVWQKSLVSDFGGAVPNWGYSESPLIDGDKLLATPGGGNCIVALNKQSGDTIWKTTGLDEGAHYSSLIAARVGDVPLYLNMTSRGLVGVSAESGKLLFRYENTGNGTATIPTPIFHDGYVYSTSGYNAGCALVRLSTSGDQVDAQEVYFNKIMKNHHGGVVLVDKHLYGHSDGGGWVCQDFMTGEDVWRERDFPKGSISYADGCLYCYSEEDGEIVLIAASPEGWQEHGRFTIPETTQLPRGSGRIWAHPVIAQGKLFLRDQDLLFCYDVQGR